MIVILMIISGYFFNFKFPLYKFSSPFFQCYSGCWKRVNICGNESPQTPKLLWYFHPRYSHSLLLGFELPEESSDTKLTTPTESKDTVCVIQRVNETVSFLLSRNCTITAVGCFCYDESAYSFPPFFPFPNIYFY